MTDTTPLGRGGQGVIILGTLTQSRVPGLLLPEKLGKLAPKWFEKLFCDESNELHLESIKEHISKATDESALEAIDILRSEAHKNDRRGKVKESVFEEIKGFLFGKKVAVKMLQWSRDDTEESARFFKSFVNELSLMASLSHPNIIKFLGFVEDMKKGDAWIILPWEANGNVREFLQSGEWTIPERISLIQDTAKGLEYLHTHDNPICHGDLKSLNILVNSSYQAVITDFGSARIRRSVGSEKEANQTEAPSKTLRSNTITPDACSPKVEFNHLDGALTLTGPGFSLRWTAPEALGTGMTDLPSDMWAMGWICWEIVTGRMPFEELHRDTTIICHTIAGKLPPIRQDGQLSHVLMLCSLMSDCWLSDPYKRIDVSTFQQKAVKMPSEIPSGPAPDGQKAQSAGLLIELGRMHELQSNRAEAQTQYLSAISIATRTEDDFAKANALQCLGRIHAANSDFEEAERSYERAREIYSRMNNSLGTANAWAGLGETYRLQSKHPETEKAFTKACETHSSIGNDLGTGNALFGLGNTYQAQSRTEEAETAFNNARETHSRIGNDLGVGNALIGLGNTYVAQLRNQEAEMAFTAAREIHSRMGNPLGTASALEGLGELYRVEFRYQEAEKAFSDAHEIHSRIGNDLGTGNALVGLGNTHLAQSRIWEAEKAFMDAHEIYSRIENHTGAANTLDGLGELYRAQAKHREAEKAFSDAHEIHSRIGNDLGTGNAVLGLGNTYLAQSRIQEAEEAFGEALQIHSRIGNDLGFATALDGLDRVQNAQLQDQEAKNACDDARTIHSPNDNSLSAENASRSHEILHGDQCARTETELYHRHVLASNDCANDSHRNTRISSNLVPGKLHHTQNRYLETEEAASKALAIATNIAHQQSQAAASQFYAEIIRLLGPKHSKGMETLFKEEAEYARTGKHAARASTWRGIGAIQAAQSLYTEAEESYHFAQAIYISIDDVSGVASAQRELGMLYIQQHRFSDAERCFIEARETYAGVHDRNEEARAMDELTFLHILRSELPAAQATCREAREIYASIGQPLSDFCIYMTGLLQVVDENLIR
ncbi:hypothetical protein FRC00_011156 [Tulasnella sp. 408]|nr:hypothetical protein FRC00_011156 [Tulasnella sp. 408]